MQGFTRIFNKIIEKNKPLLATDLTPEQKVRLYDIFARHGATQGFTYDRFFRGCFARWELEGIDNIKKRFLVAHDERIKEALKSDIINGRLYNLTSIYNTPGSFYAMVSLVRRLRTDLVAEMASLGMLSNSTVLNRFSSDNWKPWERKGVKAIIEEYVKCEYAKDKT